MKNLTLFCFLLKPNQLQAYKNFFNICFNEKKQEYADLLKRYDLNETHMWFHQIDDKYYVMFTHNMGETGFVRLAKWSESTHPFDQWFDSNLKDFLADIDSSQPVFFNKILDTR